MSRRADLMARLLDALRRANALSVAMSQAAAERIGINTTDLHCLNLLTNGPLTASELARRAGITTASVTGVIDRLETVGYVRRERDSVDRRKVIVTLQVQQAAQDVAPIFSPFVRAWRGAMEGYTDEQLELIAGFLDKTEEVFQTEVGRMRAG
ncbi:MarR family winged helix-turn-helix transcriptional regulator [Microbispora sp. KK1-11]|uniref:MarR family winged helix-turn-helix transcriptional regulator n=1 Tax=Microbispora sp. KK1-11 TaxID=2053005 RepID=UPI00115C0780|nr:MarR family transcriptional regulator [Microbispora sp. KK1-11]TQS31155.1 MarR family transcriptional regulator [Microbispora sp. KK1-11]